MMMITNIEKQWAGGPGGRWASEIDIGGFV